MTKLLTMKNALSYQKAKLSQIRCCIFFMLIFSSAIASAQTRGTVEVIKDPLIDTLMAKDPNDRPADADTAAKLMEFALDALGTPETAS